MSKYTKSILGAKIESVQENEDIFEAYYGANDPIITDHRVYGFSVIPGSLHIARIAAIVFNFYKQKYLDITEILFKNPLLLKDGEVRIVRLVIEHLDEFNASFKIISQDAKLEELADNAWILHAQGKYNTLPPTKKILTQQENLNEIKNIQLRCKNVIEIPKFDHYFKNHKLTYGSSFKWLEKITSFAAESLTTMRQSIPGPESDGLILSPGQIDCALQAFISIIFDMALNAQENDAWILGGMREIKVYQAPAGKLICYNILPEFESFTAKTRKAVGNITMFDEAGNLIAEFFDVVVINVTPEQMNRFVRS